MKTAWLWLVIFCSVANAVWVAATWYTGNPAWWFVWVAAIWFSVDVALHAILDLREPST